MKKVLQRPIDRFAMPLLVCCRILTALCLIGIFLAECTCAEPSASELEFFEARIRPVLVEHCYECHNSIDSAEGELALDFRQGLLDGGTAGPIVVPGQPAKSQLLPILRHEIPDMEMPQDGPKLSAQVIADFEKWIAIGAPDPRDEPPSADELSQATSWQAVLERRKQWWSLQPIQSPKVPNSNVAGSSDHPVDRFILQKLTEKELEPSEPADSYSLVRRLYFNLLGLPPGHQEIARWTTRLDQLSGAERKAAIAELIDQLLASPQFGERWARHWMDWIRYAESHGSEGDPPIDNAWIYRDYLIRALNADVPYDQLVREHVAGDLLDQPRINQQLGINESKIGPAHWRMVFHGFAPTDALEERVRFTDDQIDVFSKAFLGLTVSCARCHDHKFDAVSQRDYYALYGILNSCRPARVSIDLSESTDSQRKTLAELKPKIQSALAVDWLANSADLQKRILSTQKSDALLKPLLTMKTAIGQGTTFETAWQKQWQDWQQSRKKFDNYQAHDFSLAWDLAQENDYTTWFPSGTGLPKKPQPAGTFSIADQGEYALIGIYPAGVYSHNLSTKDSASLNSAYFHSQAGSELWVQTLGAGDSTIRYVVHDYPRKGTVYPIATLATQWKWQRFDLSYWDGDQLHIELAAAQDAPLLVEEKLRSWFGVRQAIVRRKGEPAPSEFDEHLQPIFDVAVSQPPQSMEELANIYQSAVTSAIKAWRDQSLTDQQALLLDACLREGLLPNQLEKLSAAKPFLEEYRQLEANIPSPTRVPGLAETVGRNQRVFDRGNHKNPTEEVLRRFLEVFDLAPYQTTQSGRLQLADDLLRDDNPLVRRVIVNRVWHHLLGQGIVNTPDNLGRLGSLPTHPKLLDWLATHFKNQGWSLKNLIRLIVTSDTWQRSSQPPTNADQSDPNNQFLAHAHVRRLEAEAIRDSLLTSSGLLVDRQFGKSVPGTEPRRSVYVRVIRNSLEPLLRVFDFPEPFTTTGRRDATNVPAQSLTMMNDAGVIQYATSWAQQILSNQELTDDRQRINRMFFTAFGRPANSSDIEEVQSYLASTKQHYQQTQKQLTDLENKIRDNLAKQQALLTPIRKRLQAAKGSNQSTDLESAPQPINHWQLEKNLNDSVGSLDAKLEKGAKLSNDELIVSKNAYAITAPITKDVQEKTLEAWVQLDNLKQQGGGVLSLQTIDGIYFDAIVFGEKQPQHWLAGSNVHARTQSFLATSETEAAQRPIHLAITYHADGHITAYRDGKPYGKSYKSNGPYPFKAGQAVLTFGLRHLPAGGNKGLTGRISRARLYDRALSADEIAVSFRVNSDLVTDDEVLAALSEANRQQYDQLQTEIKQLESMVISLGELPGSSAEIAAYTDLARAMFMMKEFIYVR